MSDATSSSLVRAAVILGLVARAHGTSTGGLRSPGTRHGAVSGASGRKAPGAREGPPPITRQPAHFTDAHLSPLTHLVYAATWGSLALAGAAIMRARFVRGGAFAPRRRAGARSS